VEIPEPGAWPETESEGVAIQLRLRSSVDLEDSCPEVLDTVTGLDVAYGKTTGRIAATAVTLDATTLEAIEESTVISEASFPYAPGLSPFATCLRC
jgi:deoxyribonuclease V